MEPTVAYLVDRVDIHGTKGVVQELENHLFGRGVVDDGARSTTHASRSFVPLANLFRLLFVVLTGSRLLLVRLLLLGHTSGARGDFRLRSLAVLFLLCDENASVWRRRDESVRKSCFSDALGRALQKIRHLDILARAFVEEKGFVFLGHVFHGELIGAGPSAEMQIL